MSVDTIKTISKAAGAPFVPPPESYRVLSDRWVESEYHCFRDPSDQVLVSYWDGEPGAVDLGQWPYDEVCVIVRGRVALIDAEGGRREFGAGEAFVVPRSFVGTWETMEPTEKIFIAIDTAGTAEEDPA